MISTILNRKLSLKSQQFHAPSKWHIVCFNVGKLSSPYNCTSNDEFRNDLGPINALAEAAPGFLWMYDHDMTFDTDRGKGGEYFKKNPLLMPQLSLWENYESLRHFVIRSGHASYLRRRREWFDSLEKPYTVCWYREKVKWDQNHLRSEESSNRQSEATPTLEEALERLELLKINGRDTPEAFKFGKEIPDPIDD